MSRMPSVHFTTVWEFDVGENSQREFEKIYGPAGAWAQLFRRSPGYLGTELLRDLGHPGRYLTLYHWNSREAFERFKHDHETEYAALDQRCDKLTEREVFLGEFNRVEEPV